MPEKEAPKLETWAGQNVKTLELEIDKEIDSLFVPTFRKAAGDAVAGACPGQDSHPHKSEPSNTAGPAINLDAMQIEIDKEIDSLFVPTFRKAAGEAVAGACPGQDSHPHKSEPSNTARPAINLDAMQIEIDKEIDSLFVPTFRKAAGEAVAGACPGRDSHPHKSEPSNTVRPAINLDAMQIEIDREIDKLFIPSPPPASLSVSSASPASLDPGAGLSGLIEQFNAAYLSLDWEFSRENLKKFIDALSRLEPMAANSSDAKSVFKIMELILKRLLERPHAVNTKLVQLIRDSQGLLAHMLLMEGESGPHEKRRLKDLVEKFQDLRQKAIAVKAAGAVPPDPSCRQAESPPAKSAVPPETIRRLAESPPARVPEHTTKAVNSFVEPQEKTGATQRRVRHADACLLVSAGKWFALPASCVVKAARSTNRMGRKIFKRGYATLSDFNPFFGGANSGILGEWTKLHAKELGSYRFEPLGFDAADRSIATGPIAVLASDGQAHRIIFCDAVNFISDAEIADESWAQESPSFKIESRVLVPFLALQGQRSQAKS